MVAHDHVAGLLATEGVAGDLHRLEHVAVADLGLAHPDAGGAHGLHEAEVAHHGRDDGVLGEPALLVQREREDREELVAVDDVALGVDRQAAVGVAVEREADVGAVLEDGRLQRLRWVEPQFSLMLRPSGSAWIALTSAPASSSARGPASEAAPSAQSRTTLSPTSGWSIELTRWAA